MGSSLFITVNHAQRRSIASSNTAAGSFVIRKACTHDYKYIREFGLQLGGAKAKLIIRKFRAMFHDRQRMVLICERNGMVCAFAALKLAPLQINGLEVDAWMKEYFLLKSLDQADGVAELLESVLLEMAYVPESEVSPVLAIEEQGLSALGLEFYLNRGFRSADGLLIKLLLN